MASIRKRGGSYEITVSNGRTPDGKKIIDTATFTPDPGRTDRQNEKALMTFAADFERRVKAGLSRGDGKSFQSFAEEWLAVYGEKELEQTTLESYRHYLALVYPHIGNMKLTSIRPLTIQNTVNAIREKGYQLKNGRRKKYSEETLRGIRITISSILSAAVEDGLLQNNPCIIRKRKKKSDRQERIINAWTPEQAAVFLDRIRTPIPVVVPAHTQTRRGKPVSIKEYTGRPIIVPLKYRAFFSLALYCGCRRGEIVALTWNDINFAAGTMTIRKATHYTAKTGQYTGTPKTKQSYRELFIPAAAVSELRELKREQAREIMLLGSTWTGDRSQTTGYIFTQETGQQMNISTPGTEFHRILDAINATLPAEEQLPRIRLHDCRHTAASIMIAAGLDPVAVAHRLGHSDPTTTLRIYSHSFTESDRAAADILGQAIDSKRKAIM
ncbi:MAG: site-specific integrase [Lachnospiraceae bacterium]|nr:site-specific integrase [Lachnospiraceae bacterium]